MRKKGDVILITLLLIVSVNAQKKPEISDLKTQTITLSRKAPKDKTAPPRFWILVDSVKAAEFKGPPSTDKTPPMAASNPGLQNDPRQNVIDAASSATNVGQVQVVNLLKRRYSIAYGVFSSTPDDLWLHVVAAPVGGMGLLMDMGAMKWEEVDRMPALVLKPITPGIRFSINHGMRTVGPQGLVVRALAGHVYATQIKDDRTDYRVIFRIDSIDSNGDCNISWKRIPSKWAAWTLPAQPNKLDARLASLFLS